MKVILSLVLLGLIAVVVAKEYRCPDLNNPVAYFPYPNVHDCKSYFFCINGYTFKHSCLMGDLFDAVALSCRPYNQAKCAKPESEHIDPTTTTTEAASTTTTEAVSTPTTEVASTTATEVASTTTTEVASTTTTEVASTTATEAASTTTTEVASTTTTEAALTTITEVASTTTTTEATSTTITEVASTTTTTEAASTTTTEAASTTTTEVASTTEAEPCPKVTCPPQSSEIILLPNVKNCSSFYQCSHGHPILQYCPPSLHFNDKLKYCDYPGDAGCVQSNCQYF